MLVKNDVFLKPYTSYQIGGLAKVFVEVDTVEELKELDSKLLADAYILGAGTNILVSDKGVEKPVIKINLSQRRVDSKTNILTVEAGALVSEVSKEMAGKGLGGLLSVAGIPGSIGGAIIMNASASHGAISDNLIEVVALNKKSKETKMFKKKECQFGFRRSIFQGSDWIITEAWFQLKPKKKEELLDFYNKICEHRKRYHPLLFPSAGCWFKRGWGGRDIIKKLGMVGEWKGRAVLSPLFPAFILNTGEATAKDIYFLAKKVQDRAKEINEDMPFEIVVWG